jgi:hypothetical protein
MSSDFNDQQMKRIAAFGEVAGKLAGQLQRACRSCVHCDHFNQGRELCQLNGQRPPAKIIAFGCECYEDEIPF